MEELANQIQRALDERLYPSGVYSFRDLAQEVISIHALLTEGDL